MAKYTGPACRLCRREGTKLMLKGDKCVSNKCPLLRREKAPGQHGMANGRKRTKEYGLQLREKQKANVVYRMGMAESRREARQLVLHGHFTVNGKRVDIPSYIVNLNDVVAVKESSRKSEKIKSLVENISGRVIPGWLSVDKENAVATVAALPKREDIDFPFEEHLIVELYSK